LALVLIEWSRKRARIAEIKQAVAETDLSIKNKQDEIQKAADEKDPDTIINDYLAKQSGKVGNKNIP
jgi:hypothetical protein